MLAVIVLPLLLLSIAEGALRLVGMGYPTAFFLPHRMGKEAVLLNNPRYAWRFFPESLARTPWAFTLPAEKATNCTRIFVLGESAALGDPDPRFSVARMLEALLSLRHPEREFQVVNTAFTAINSHTILPIARECAGQAGDIWVVYMGNNEVVGPFGAGTVFSQQTPPLPLIRAGLGVKTTRLGQFLDRGLSRLRGGDSAQMEWAGMEMFTEQQVRRSDPRMRRVYKAFESNLREILELGHQAGAKIVLSTVACNLRDCPPFASQHRQDFPSHDRGEWEKAYRRAVAMQEREDFSAAVAQYRGLLQTDDQFAALHFRLGACLLALSDRDAADAHFREARDLDCLRFRADTRLNAIIRACAKEYEGPQFRFLDAETELAQGSPDSLPGREFFYEHVHLTPEGNFRLALSLAKEVEALLDWEKTLSDVAPQWASADTCFAWLGLTDASRHGMLDVMVRRVALAPFVSQMHHNRNLDRLEAESASYRASTRPAGIRAVSARIEALAADRPRDAYLRSLAAETLQLAGKTEAAELEYRAALALLPNAHDLWTALGVLLEAQGREQEAVQCYERCLELHPWQTQARARLKSLSVATRP